MADNLNNPKIKSSEQKTGTESSAHNPAADYRDDPTHGEISARAYDCWNRRGCVEGNPEEDWYQAEEELRAERARTGQVSKSAAAGS